MDARGWEEERELGNRVGAAVLPPPPIDCYLT